MIHSAVPGTNNESERTVRDAANDQKTGRTSKTIRRTVLMSVLESLRLSLPDFTLSHLLQEVISWLSTGRPRFRQLLKAQKLPPPECSTLDALLSATGGPRPADRTSSIHDKHKSALTQHLAYPSRCAEANEELAST